MTLVRPGAQPVGQESTRPLVTVKASNLCFSAEPGETVFEAAGRHGYAWPTICGGKADCTRCFMEVLDGAENLSPMGPAEREALDRCRWRGEERPWERLACCARVLGSVTVRRRSVRPRERGEVA
jgi:ferredoxin